MSLACILGTGCVYLLSVTGKDYAIAKGGFYGEVAWSFIYGALGRIGLSSLNISSPKTTISQCVAHISFGLTAGYLITTFGDEGLFTGKIPISASNQYGQDGPQ